MIGCRVTPSGTEFEIETAIADRTVAMEQGWTLFPDRAAAEAWGAEQVRVRREGSFKRPADYHPSDSPAE